MPLELWHKGQLFLNRVYLAGFQDQFEPEFLGLIGAFGENLKA